MKSLKKEGRLPLFTLGGLSQVTNALLEIYIISELYNKLQLNLKALALTKRKGPLFIFKEVLQFAHSTGMGDSAGKRYFSFSKGAHKVLPLNCSRTSNFV